ncbi:MAG: hypothetical protein HYS63_07920 [Methylocystis sp.]|nr:hypothetical protein [Methylocystis sp.]
MPITLTAEQEAWFRAHVARGDFASVEEAARQLIDERIAERMAQEARRALPVGALSDADLDSIAQTEMDPRHRHLDRELD